MSGDQVKTAPSGFFRPFSVQVMLASELRSRSLMLGRCRKMLGLQFVGHGSQVVQVGHVGHVGYVGQVQSQLAKGGECTETEE